MKGDNETFDEALGYFFQNRDIRNTLYTYYYLFEAEKVPGYDPELEKILEELKETADELDKTLNI